MEDPFLLKNDKVVMFDVDDTLVMWDYPASEAINAVKVDSNGMTYYLLPHAAHIELIKRHVAWGYDIVVWSRSGYEWAKTIVNVLGLEPYVSMVMAKPMFYYDDRKCCEVLGEHRYIGKNNGTTLLK